jgi:hypothetical protein
MFAFTSALPDPPLPWHRQAQQQWPCGLRPHRPRPTVFKHDPTFASTPEAIHTLTAVPISRAIAVTHRSFFRIIGTWSRSAGSIVTTASSSSSVDIQNEFREGVSVLPGPQA